MKALKLFIRLTLSLVAGWFLMGFLVFLVSILTGVSGWGLFHSGAPLLVLFPLCCALVYWALGRIAWWKKSVDNTAPDWVSEAARARGPVPSGCYRVAVLESSGELAVRDFADKEAAQQYANDAASESDTPSLLAYVFDDRLQFVARGRHYAAP